MSNLPGCSSDSGPVYNMTCRACGRQSCDSVGDCANCGRPCCDRCASSVAYSETGQPTYTCWMCGKPKCSTLEQTRRSQLRQRILNRYTSFRGGFDRK